VKVPPEAYDKWGSLTFWHPSQGKNALGQEYNFREEERYCRRGNPEMWRTRRQVIRRANMKVLGESVIYIRRGGDMPGPWHESSLSCPEPKDASVIDRVFVRARTE
jgi:hypothetical protein